MRRFRVQFPDGTIFDEGKGKATFIKVLRKIGLKRICKEAPEIEHAGYNLVGTVPCRGDDGKINERKQEQIDGYYVFKNTDTPDKIMDILKISRKFGLGLNVYTHEGVNLTYVEKFQDAPRTSKKIESQGVKDYTLPLNASIKERFEHWLNNRMSVSGARTYLSTLNNAVKVEINKYVDVSADSVFTFTTLEEMQTCVELLLANDEFVSLDQEKHHSLMAPIKKWIEFLHLFNDH